MEQRSKLAGAHATCIACCGAQSHVASQLSVITTSQRGRGVASSVANFICTTFYCIDFFCEMSAEWHFMLQNNIFLICTFCELDDRQTLKIIESSNLNHSRNVVIFFNSCTVQCASDPTAHQHSF